MHMNMCIYVQVLRDYCLLYLFIRNYCSLVYNLLYFLATIKNQFIYRSVCVCVCMCVHVHVHGTCVHVRVCVCVCVSVLSHLNDFRVWAHYLRNKLESSYYENCFFM